MMYREIWATPIAEFFSSKEVHDELLNILNQTDLSCLNDDSNIFTSWVKDCSAEYLTKFYTSYKNIHILSGYLSIQKYGESFKTHAHDRADIAAVYYADTFPDHPNLQLIDTRPAHKFNSTTVFNNNKKCNDVRLFEVKPETGKLLLFPAYILHSVDANLIEQPRYAFSMNIILE